MPKAPATNRATNEVVLLVGNERLSLRILSGTVSDHGFKRQLWINLPVLDEKGEPKHQFVVVDGKKKKIPVTVDHKVGVAPIDKNTGDLLTDEQNEQVAKKAETEDGQLVWVSDAEIETLLNFEPDTLTVKAFQPVALFARREYVAEKPYFVEVGRDKKNKPIKRDGTLLGALLATMREDNLIAVCELVTRGLPKPAVLFGDGTLMQVWHHDALREGPALPEVEMSAEAFEGIREAFIEDLFSVEPLDLTDERSALIEAFVEEKAANGDFDKTEDTYTKREKKDQAEDVDNVLSLLKRSVEKAKATKATKAS